MSVSRKHDPYAAFRIQSYRRYILGWFFAIVGNQVQGIAIGWDIYQRTGQALSLGLVGLAQACPPSYSPCPQATWRTDSTAAGWSSSACWAQP